MNMGIEELGPMGGLDYVRFDLIDLWHCPRADW